MENRPLHDSHSKVWIASRTSGIEALPDRTAHISVRQRILHWRSLDGFWPNMIHSTVPWFFASGKACSHGLPYHQHSLQRISSCHKMDLCRSSDVGARNQMQWTQLSMVSTKIESEMRYSLSNCCQHGRELIHNRLNSWVPVSFPSLLLWVGIKAFPYL